MALRGAVQKIETATLRLSTKFNTGHSKKEMKFHNIKISQECPTRWTFNILVSDIDQKINKRGQLTLSNKGLKIIGRADSFNQWPGT